MDAIKTLTTTYQSCVVELNPETRECLGIPPDATVIMHAKNGVLEVEVLPSPTPELLATAQRLHEKYQAVFEEMKRLGD